MKWQEVRNRHPHCWVLVEATEAHAEAEHWLADELAAVDAYEDVTKAMSRYKRLHHDAPQRDLFVAHTDNSDLSITSRSWMGGACGSIKIDIQGGLPFVSVTLVHRGNSLMLGKLCTIRNGCLAAQNARLCVANLAHRMAMGGDSRLDPSILDTPSIWSRIMQSFPSPDIS